MAARLGNVLHWVANTVAILLLVVGALRGWVEYMLPTFGHSNDYSPTALLFAAATGAWLLGRTCLYVLAAAPDVLAAAPADKLPPTGPYDVFGKLRKTKFSDVSNRSTFDIQLGQALINERRLANIFENGKIEVKSESYLWERTRNICIEYEQNGKPSGIAITEAEHWIHELLLHDGSVLVRLMFPVPRLKELCRRANAEGRYRKNAGDGGRFSVFLVPLLWAVQSSHFTSCGSYSGIDGRTHHRDLR